MTVAYIGAAEGFGTWLTVDAGHSNSTHYDDRHLPLFTTFQYRLTAYNDFAFTISSTSSRVATFGGVPSLPANVSVHTLNHTSIHVNWTLPCQYIVY